MKRSITIDVTRTYTSKPPKSAMGSINNNLNTVMTIETSQDLAKLVCDAKGARTWSPSVFNGSRSNANWKGASIVALDFDGGVTPDEVLSMLSSKGVEAGLVYATFSDSPELRKFRVVMFLDREVTDMITYNSFLLGLMSFVEGKADAACKDLSRMWLGGKKVLSVSDAVVSVDALIEMTKDLSLNSNVVAKCSVLGVAFNKGETVKDSKLDVAVSRVKVLQDLRDGVRLGHQEVFGLATNLKWIEGGIEWMTEMMNKCGQYSQNSYDAIKTALDKDYNPMRLQSFSKYDADWGLTNCVYAGMAVDYSNGQCDITYIDAPAGALYVAEFLDTLPSGILNKKECGCGATHLVLTNIEQVVVAVPLTEMIDNKVAQHNSDEGREKGLFPIFGVKAGVTKEDFIAYANSTALLKIMVTYDSLWKVTQWLEESNELKVTSLVVDEYHQMLSEYSYRDKGVNSLLGELDRYSKVTFLTATPIAPAYAPPQLTSLPYTEIRWDNPIRVKPVLKKTNKPYAAVVNMIKAHKAAGNSTDVNGLKAKELYIFLNSVMAIKDVIDNAGLTNAEVKVICADTKDNRTTLGTVNISKALDANKPFTFVTKKAFTGCDFYSESGLTVVVSNVNRTNTMYDVATDIFQIAGRIRNKENPFKSTIIHIFNNGAGSITRAEFDAYVEAKIEDTKTVVETYNSFDLSKKRAFYNALLRNIEDVNENHYMHYNSDKDEFEYNELAMMNEKYRFYITNDIYENGVSLRRAYAAGGFDIREGESWTMIEDEFVTNATRRSFETVCKEYVDAINIGADVTEFEKEHHILKEVREKLGISMFSACKYKEKELKQELYNESDAVKNALFGRLTKLFKSGEFYSSKTIKEKLTELFDEFKVTKSTKATTLGDYLTITEEGRRIDGKMVKGYTIKYHILKH